MIQPPEVILAYPFSPRSSPGCGMQVLYRKRVRKRMWRDIFLNQRASGSFLLGMRMIKLFLPIFCFLTLSLMSGCRIATFSFSHISQFKGSTNRTSFADFSPDGKRIVTTSGNFAIIWDVKSGKELKRLVGHTHTVNSAIILFDDYHSHWLTLC